MRILHVNTRDRAGGAEKVAYDLYQAYSQHGHQAYLAVGVKTEDAPGILEIPNNSYRNFWARIWRTRQESLARYCQPVMSRLASWLANIGELKRWSEWQRGIEDFNYPGTAHLFSLLPRPPDIVHAHNLHGGYFDLRVIAEISHRFPVVLTLHDEWSLTGHCAYTFGCNRWEYGCGSCPNLNTYPAVRRDATAYNWQRKHEIYSRSRLYVSAPSRWLLDKAIRSILKPAIIQARVIPNGIDLSIFCPGDKREARSVLGLPQDADIALFVANRASTNQFKDFGMVEAAILHIADKNRDRNLIFVCLGEEKEDQRIGSVITRFAGYQSDPVKIAQFYRAADVYLHAAKAEAFGTAITEALACGIPVIATAVDGIPEVVTHGSTGFLVPAGNGAEMASRLEQLLEDTMLRQRMGNVAIEHARQHFDFERQVKDYLTWYQDILADQLKIRKEKSGYQDRVMGWDHSEEQIILG